MMNKNWMMMTPTFWSWTLKQQMLINLPMENNQHQNMDLHSITQSSNIHFISLWQQTELFMTFSHTQKSQR